MEPRRFIGQPVYTDDHRGRYIGRLEEATPPRNPMTVTGEHHYLGRIRRDVHRDLPTTVVVERLGDKLSRYRVGPRRSRRWFGNAVAAGCVVIRCRTPISESRHLHRSLASAFSVNDSSSERDISSVSLLPLPIIALLSRDERPCANRTCAPLRTMYT
jgi:hypothetical protein